MMKLELEQAAVQPVRKSPRKTAASCARVVVKFQYDAEHDLLHLQLSDAPVHRSLGTQDVSRVVDYDEQGEVVGIELLGASQQIETVQALQELTAAVQSRRAKAPAVA
jgi:uncharacterized protein YuzE